MRMGLSRAKVVRANGISTPASASSASHGRSSQATRATPVAARHPTVARPASGASGAAAARLPTSNPRQGESVSGRGEASTRAHPSKRVFWRRNCARPARGGKTVKSANPHDTRRAGETRLPGHERATSAPKRAPHASFGTRMCTAPAAAPSDHEDGAGSVLTLPGRRDVRSNGCDGGIGDAGCSTACGSGGSGAGSAGVSASTFAGSTAMAMKTASAVLTALHVGSRISRTRRECPARRTSSLPANVPSGRRSTWTSKLRRSPPASQRGSTLRPISCSNSVRDAHPTGAA